ncbi:hypothetical protein [Anaplasma phagocytophilum]|uniref:hypothetical protein n=1 Tax=Anaplasma phagocytophilum TaxID=948 RepID=UPI00061FF25C|nr:putative major surface protein hypervariable region [Anaplasma phagocytophilum str. ApNYW]
MSGPQNSNATAVAKDLVQELTPEENHSSRLLAKTIEGGEVLRLGGFFYFCDGQCLL